MERYELLMLIFLVSLQLGLYGIQPLCTFCPCVLIDTIFYVFFIAEET